MLTWNSGPTAVAAHIQVVVVHAQSRAVETVPRDDHSVAECCVHCRWRLGRRTPCRRCRTCCSMARQERRTCARPSYRRKSRLADPGDDEPAVIQRRRPQGKPRPTSADLELAAPRMQLGPRCADEQRQRRRDDAYRQPASDRDGRPRDHHRSNLGAQPTGPGADVCNGRLQLAAPAQPSDGMIPNQVFAGNSTPSTPSSITNCSSSRSRPRSFSRS